MRTWGRVYGTKKCATCGVALRDGSPAQMLELPNVKRKIIYGPCCATSDVPPDLPPRVVHTPLFDPMAPIQHSTPKRTRGGLTSMAREWTPYAERE